MSINLFGLEHDFREGIWIVTYSLGSGWAMCISHIQSCITDILQMTEPEEMIITKFKPFMWLELRPEHKLLMFNLTSTLLLLLIPY